MTTDVTIRTRSIGLAAFLKWSGITSSGAQAKALIRDGQVKVNDDVVVTPARQVGPGDLITVASNSFRVKRQP